MNAVALPNIAERVDGGFYVARFNIAVGEHALIVAPKAFGERDDIEWNRSLKSVEGAISWNDGYTNTVAMAKAGSRLAEWALDLTVDGCGGFYLASLDEAELCYRRLKPGTAENSQWGRSGINLSAVPPTWPYTLAEPSQTILEVFRAGGTEAFEEAAYWTSTQHASGSDSAWVQYFDDGGQGSWGKGNELRARAVRRLKI
jgi:hypothetical protein